MCIGKLDRDLKDIYLQISLNDKYKLRLKLLFYVISCIRISLVRFI